MVMVELPEGVVRADIPLNGDETVYSYKHAVGVQDTLFHDFKIEVMYVCIIIIHAPPNSQNVLYT